MNQPDLLQRALARLILRHPFLATLALRLERIEDPAAGTAWTDGVHLAVEPTWFAQLTPDDRVTLVAHECYHVALAHHRRRGGRDLTRWNRACDYAVNALLLADGFPLLPDALHDPTFGDASAEAIYQHLPSRPDDADSGNGANAPASPSTSGTSVGAAPAAASSPGTSPPGTRAANPAAPPLTSSGNSAPSPAAIGPAPPASGTAAPAPPPAGPETFGQVRDQPSPTPPMSAEQQARLTRHGILITALAQQARAAGKDSAGARRAATAAVQPATVDWRALLAEFLTARHTQDYSSRRPNPRYAVLGLFLPVLEATAPGSVAFVIDTSGSVPKAALDAVTAELEAYLRQYPSAILDVLYADAAVTGRATYTAADLPLRLEPIGGGGTDFRPALTALEEADEPPACVVYLTDLEGTFPAEPPPLPVIWLVFGEPLDVPIAPFGRVVALPYR